MSYFVPTASRSKHESRINLYQQRTLEEVEALVANAIQLSVELGLFYCKLPGGVVTKPMADRLRELGYSLEFGAEDEITWK